jgi:hypothetical protein
LSCCNLKLHLKLGKLPFKSEKILAWKLYL